MAESEVFYNAHDARGFGWYVGRGKGSGGPYLTRLAAEAAKEYHLAFPDKPMPPPCGFVYEEDVLSPEWPRIGDMATAFFVGMAFGGLIAWSLI